MTDLPARIHFATAFDPQKSPIHVDGADVVLFDLDEAARYGETHRDAVYTPAEVREIAGVAASKRKREKLAGKLAAKVLAREMLSRHSAQDHGLHEFEVLAAGHPVSVRHTHPSILDELFVSISHTDGLVCAAAGPSATGIDVERTRPLTPDLAAELMGPQLVEEVERRRGLPERIAPFVVFTQKEAVLKAAGVGLERGLDGVRLAETAPEAFHDNKRYRVATVFDDRYVMSLACLDDEREVAVSAGQEGIWFLHQLEDQGATYNLAYALELRGALDVEALRHAIEMVVHRHEVLRTVFPGGDGRCRAVVRPPARFELPVAEVAAGQVEDRARRFAGTPVPLDEAPLLRSQLLRADASRHVLALAIHHIAFDAASVHVLLTEIAHGYQGASAAPAPLAVQFADLAAREREALRGERSQAALSFWKSTLAGAPRLSGRSSPRGAVRRFELPEALTVLSREQGVTLFVTLLTAFKALLVRWTGETDVVVGVPFQGRMAPGADTLIGYFVNTLPVRADLSSDPSFRELLTTVRAAVYDAFEHQDLPLAKLVETVAPARGSGTMSLFRVVAQALHAGAGFKDAAPRMELPGLECTCRQLDTGGVPFDLVLTLDRVSGRSLGKFEYRLDQFDDAAIDRMIGHLRVLVEGAVADPDRPVSTLPILTGAERGRLLDEFNDTGAEYPREATVHGLFEEQAARAPDAVAVVSGDDTLTYGELNERANRLAHHLRALGVGPSRPVACLVERSFDLVVSLLGVMKAGGAYLPLDPDDPADRLRYVVNDAGAQVALMRRGDMRRLEIPGAVCLDEMDLSGQSHENPPGETRATELAYVTYTSGSTGRPKGVEIPHRAVIRLLFGVNYAPLRAGEVFLQIAPVAFDASTFELWGALLHGSTVVLYEASEMDPRELERVAKKNRVTCVFLTTALFNTLIDEHPESLEGVRCLIFGGDRVSVPHVRRALERLPETDLVHAYGPTEATTFTCCYPVPRDLARGARTIPIGRPIANTRVYILDAHGEPTPVGCVGEIHIGGDAPARGYVGPPERSADRFLPNPFHGGRMYRTGDLGRFLPGGEIEFAGRRDDQVKLRGYRVEPGEIEAALSEHPSVGQCAVIVNGEDARKTLVAHVETDVPDEQLRRYLSERLPAYMIPARFVAHDAMPVTSNGKIDRGALERGTPRERVPTGPRRPEDAFERILTQLWRDVLGVERVGRNDDFFDLGGHSLLALALSARIEERFGIVLPLAKLFAAPTVARLVAVIHERIDVSPVSVLQAEGAEPPLFLVPGVGGHSCGLSMLAKQLGTEQPCYGLQFPGVDGKQTPHARVDRLATALVEQIRSVQPSGPYFVGGYSFGGMVAQDIARQLAERGEQVALLVLLDPTDLHGYRSNRVGRNVKTLRRRWSSFRRRLRRRLKDEAKESSVARFIARVSLAARHAEMAFRPGEFPGRAILFRSGRVSAADFWVKRRCGEVEEVLLPGDHFEILRAPHVQGLAERLRASLRRARTVRYETGRNTRG